MERDTELKYTAPKIVDYGDVREITAGRSGHQNADAILQTGQNSFNHSTGPCIGFGVPCQP